MMFHLTPSLVRATVPAVLLFLCLNIALKSLEWVHQDGLKVSSGRLAITKRRGVHPTHVSKTDTFFLGEI